MQQKNVDKRALCEIPVPDQTSTYKPISYCTLIDLTLKYTEEAGLVLKSEKYTSTGNGMIATGIYDFDYGDDPELGLRIAWQNSYNKQVSLKFAIGAHVFVCSNGACFGDMGAFKKKHVGEVQTITPDMIKEYIDTAKQVYSKVVSHKNQMQSIQIDNKEIVSIVGSLYFIEDILKETQISIIKKELSKPTFDYNSSGTAWELYNHVTYSLKEVHPRDYIEKHVGIHEFFVQYFNLKD